MIVQDWVVTVDRIMNVAEAAVWNEVIGPTSAAMANLISVGWKPFGPTLWKDTDGQRWTIYIEADVHFFTMHHFDHILRLRWKDAAGHLHGQGAQDGADLTVAGRLLK